MLLVQTERFPAKDWGKWEQLVENFTRHLVERYGVDEVAQWYFEVGTSPTLISGPVIRRGHLLRAIRCAARAIKRVSPRLRVGGRPRHRCVGGPLPCALQRENVPVDFASTHVYGMTRPRMSSARTNRFHEIKWSCRAVKKVHDQIAASLSRIPLIWSEFNASYMNEPAVTDTAFMGP